MNSDPVAEPDGGLVPVFQQRITVALIALRDRRISQRGHASLNLRVLDPQRSMSCTDPLLYPLRGFDYPESGSEDTAEWVFW